MVAMPAIRTRIVAYSRRARAGLGLALLLLSGTILIGGLILMMAAGGNGAPSGGIQIVAIALGGALFVATQSLATAFLLSIAHPGGNPRRAQPSINRTPEGNEK